MGEITPRRTGPANAIAVLHRAYGEIAPLIIQRTSAPEVALVQSMIEISGSISRHWPENARREALARIELFPTLDELEAQRVALRATVYEPAKETEVRAILAMMLDAIPAAGAQITRGYTDALVFSVLHEDDESGGRWRGFSGPVLMSAARHILRTATFAPSIAKVLSAARKSRERAFTAFATTNRMLALRQNAEDTIEDTEPVEASKAVGPDDIPF